MASHAAQRTNERRVPLVVVITIALVISVTNLGLSKASAEETSVTVAPDPTVVAVVDGPGGIGYWVVAADGSIEVVGTSIVPPLGERDPITDRVRTAYAGAPGALGIWLELADGTKLAVGDPGPRIFTGHDRPPGWLSGLAVKQLMAGRWIDEIDRGCVTELPRAVRIGQLLLPAMTESQFGAAIEESRDHQIAGILLSGGATPWIGRRITELQDVAGRIPLLMAVDEEGGRVQRLSGVLPNLPSAARQVNERLELVSQRAKRHAGQMLELGFGVNFAPVLDVGSGPGIGDRSFSNDPSLVADYGMATIEGLSDGGVLPVVKHFPGHGSADSDSHLGRSIGPPLAELRENDLVPFIEAIAFRKAAIMVGHIVVPGLTDDLPASLSKAAIDGLLRSDLNFDGLVVTDSLNMRSISDHWTVDEAAVMSLAAGADLLVLGNLADVGPAFDAIDRAVHEGLIPVDRVDDAANRVLRAKNINACTLVGRVRGVLNTVYDW